MSEVEVIGFVVGAMAGGLIGLALALMLIDRFWREG